MPKVNQRVARKDYPHYGIAKGQSHYHWVLKTGPRSSREFRQIAPPKRSQLTNSEYLGTLYDIQDSIDAATDPAGLRVCADELETLGQEQTSKFENMPEGLQQGDTGQLLEERASNCEQAASAINSACDDFESEHGEDRPEEKDEPEEDENEEDEMMGDNGGPDLDEDDDADDDERDPEEWDSAFDDLKSECAEATNDC